MSEDFLPFALPDIDNSELAEIKETLDSGWITTGLKVKKFEAMFAEVVGAKHAIAVNSCTAAMHLALEAICLRRDDLVITTPYTFAATAEVIRYFDAIPVFVDVRADSLNIDPALVADAIHDLHRGPRDGNNWMPPALRDRQRSIVGKRISAILPVHIAGLPTELNALYNIAASHNLPIIEDAAHAFPSKYKGRFIGSPPSNHNLRQATCFSFYATKTITTGEGGMICADDEDLVERCRIMALHGITKDAWKRYTAEGSWYYEIIAPGYKYNMTDIAAAIGLAQLAKSERMWQRRKDIAQRYNEAFRDLGVLQIPDDQADCQHAWYLYMLRLDLEHLRIDRAQFIKELKRRNIGASVHFIPLHIHPYYQKTYGYKPEDFPVAYREYLREISLPIYSKMTDQDIQNVTDAVTDIVRSYKR